MEAMTRREWLRATGASVAVGGLAALAAQELAPPGDAGRRWRHPEPARQALQKKHLPNVDLLTHQGVSVRFYDDLVRDRKVLINFVDTRNLPHAAVVTANLAVLQRLLGTRVGGEGDISMYSIASAPRRDTPEVLKAWADRHGARPGWLFLTGEPAKIETLRRALGFTYADPREDGDPSSVGGILRHGNEPEMRWAHCQAMADPRQVALRIVADFGPNPALPRDPQWFCSDATVAPLG